MTAYHMLVATIGTRILQRLPFDRLKAKRIQMDVSRPWMFQAADHQVGVMVENDITFEHSLLCISHPQQYGICLSERQLCADAEGEAPYVMRNADVQAFIPIFTLIVQLVTGIQGKYT
jgi:hypothetical protein